MAQQPDIATNTEAVGECRGMKISWTNGSNIHSVRVLRNHQRTVSQQTAQSLPVQDFCEDKPLPAGAYTYTVQSWRPQNWPGNPKSSTPDFTGHTRFGCSTVVSGTAVRSEATLELLSSRRDAISHFTTPSTEAANQRVWTSVDMLVLPDNNVIQDSAFSLIQNTSGKLQAVARVTPSQGTGEDQLVVYEFDLIPDPQGSQHPPIRPMPFVSDIPPAGVIGNPALIQTDQGTLELLISVGGKILHYAKAPLGEEEWKLDPRILELPGGASPASQFTAVSLIQNTSGKLEAIARVSPIPDGLEDYLSVFEFDPAPTSYEPIIAHKLFTGDGHLILGVTGTSALLQSDPDTLELLVAQGNSIGEYAKIAIEESWTLVSTLPLRADPQVEETAISLLPSYSIPGKLEAIAQVAPKHGLGRVRVYSYEFLPGQGWTGPIPANLPHE